MKLSYNDFQLGDLGEFTVTQKREFEGGDAPQRAKVTLEIKLMLFERSYADNYALLRQAKDALQSPNGTLAWVNDDSGETYVNQTATLTSQDFPEEWGTYFQQLNLTFYYYENLDTAKQNLPLKFLKEGATSAMLFDHVTGWTEGGTNERFSTLRKHRNETKGRLEVKGWILGDPTVAMDARRATLVLKVKELREAMNSAQGRLTFGEGAQQVFDGTVRIGDFKAEVDQATTQIEYSFTATYTLFPNEEKYATVEATVAETDNMSGELTLAIQGKIQANDEPAARAKLAALLAALLKSYGYAKGQQMELDTTPNLISANADGDTFTELTFTGRWRKWRTTNQEAAYVKKGGSKPVPFGNVRTWIDHYIAARFDELRDQRRLATNSIEVSGTFAGDATMKLSDRRAALLAMQRRMKAEVASASGQLTFGDFNQAVRVDDFRAEINQAETGIEWTFKAHYTVFPNEDSYCTVEANFAETDMNNGEVVLAANGKIQAVDEATGRAKLAKVIAAALKQYGYTAAGVPMQAMELETTPNLISANEDGDTFTELSFTGKWRRFKKTNLAAGYTPPGAQPVPMGNIRSWSSHYTASRFNLLRGQREHGTVDIEAGGVLLGDANVSLDARRAQLLAMQTALLAAVNTSNGVLNYGKFSQNVRVDDFKADINQAETGIEWTLKAHYTLFPNEANYATCEATFAESDNQTGEVNLALSGRIQAANEDAGRTKLAAVIKAALKQYGYDKGQQLELVVTPNLISANEDGDTFTELTFTGRWRRWDDKNLRATYQGGSAEPIPFGNVRTWVDHYTATRYNPLRDQRDRAQIEVELAGTFAGDPTLSLDDRRKQLRAMAQRMKTEVNSASGVLVFGDFSQRVRVDDFKAEVNQSVSGIEWTLKAHYTPYPNESTYAACEATAEEKNTFNGELTLTVNGKVQAATEAIARTKMTTVMAALQTQYGYDKNSQQIELTITPNQISAPGDGDTFTELTFNAGWRRWSKTNQQASFQAIGQKDAIPFGNVKTWDDGYKADRFDLHRSERRHATGTISATGTFAGDASLSLVERRKQLLAMQRRMKQEVNSAEGTLRYGDWTQTVRIEEFIAHINQTETGIDWAFNASYSLFPNEGGYATAEFTADVRDDIEAGDRYLSFAGEVQAPNGALARAKLNTLRTATLAIYGFTAGQRLRGQAATHEIAANGDTTSTVPEGIETQGDVSGVSFLRLTFNEEYRQRMPGTVISSQYTVTSRDETTAGVLITTYAGSVTATGVTADAAAAAALLKARAIGAGKEGAIDATAFLKSQSLTLEKRQTSQSVSEEFVRVAFSYEYQSRLGAGRAYMEVNTQTTADAFGPDAESVSGFIIARDFTVARAMYDQQVKAGYANRLIRQETLTEAVVKAETVSSLVLPVDTFVFNTQPMRLEFSFTVHKDKRAGRATARYAISVQRDFRSNKKVTRLRGSVFATNRGAADTFLAALTVPLGSLVESSRDEDRDVTPEADVFTKLDFDDVYEDRLTGVTGLNDCRVTESVTYSGTRWAVQPIPFATNGGGGVSIPQAAGLTEGSRTIRGSVSAATLATALDWAYRHRKLLTGDRDGGFYPQPEQIETDYEFVPRVDGIAEDGLAGGSSKANVQIYRVNFTFSEILPNYRPSL